MQSSVVRIVCPSFTKLWEYYKIVWLIIVGCYNNNSNILLSSSSLLLVVSYKHKIHNRFICKNDVVALKNLTELA